MLYIKGVVYVSQKKTHRSSIKRDIDSRHLVYVVDIFPRHHFDGSRQGTYTQVAAFGEASTGGESREQKLVARADDNGRQSAARR